MVVSAGLLAIALAGTPLTSHSVEMTRSGPPTTVTPVDGEEVAGGQGSDGRPDRGPDLDPQSDPGSETTPPGPGNPGDGTPGNTPPDGGVGEDTDTTTGGGGGGSNGGGSDGGGSSGGGGQPSGGGGGQPEGNQNDQQNQQALQALQQALEQLRQRQQLLEQELLRQQQAAQQAYQNGYQQALLDQQANANNQPATQPGGGGTQPATQPATTNTEPATTNTEPATTNTEPETTETEPETTETEPEDLIGDADPEKLAALAPKLADIAVKHGAKVKEEKAAREEAEAKETAARGLCDVAKLVKTKNNYFVPGYAERIQTMCDELKDEAATKLARADELEKQIKSVSEEANRYLSLDIPAELAAALRLLNCHLNGGDCLVKYLEKQGISLGPPES